jgi:hypothetical protein
VTAQKEGYSVLGIKEYCALANIIREYEESGVGLLRNESVLLTAQLQVSGIDPVKTIDKR